MGDVKQPSKDSGAKCPPSADKGEVVYVLSRVGVYFARVWHGRNSLYPTC